MLRARDRERAAIDRLLDLARASHGGGLVLRGEAGIGKSALLAYGRERVGGMRVLHATCVEAESALAYATLHQLLRPILHFAPEIPSPQQQVLRIALGLEPGGAPERFLISLAALSLLSEAATEQPILCVLDDMHWADDPSREIVAFVARRLESEPIALLASVRDGEGRDLEAAGMHVLDVTRLSHEQAMALLDEQSGTRLAPAVRDALIAAHWARSKIAARSLNPTVHFRGERRSPREAFNEGFSWSSFLGPEFLHRVAVAHELPDLHYVTLFQME